MGALLIPLIVLAVLVVVLWVGMRAWAGRRAEVADELARLDTETLDYAVPPGQDPAVVITALTAEGYDATPDPSDVHLVHVACPAGTDRDRARVRATIEAARTTAIDDGVPFSPGPIRFLDEGA